uniref:Uncharacterized protein n=1 Tax=Candidatus Kentrum sp. SD TaxID=2126332 RepID=A0A451BPA1_9GAMM|nr:MAG: hypothetical protein BECKSD772D_GA0070982_108713 [Candidatus Kentron sp. SD]
MTEERSTGNFYFRPDRASASFHLNLSVNRFLSSRPKGEILGSKTGIRTTGFLARRKITTFKIGWNGPLGHCDRREKSSAFATSSKHGISRPANRLALRAKSDRGGGSRYTRRSPQNLISPTHETGRRARTTRAGLSIVEGKSRKHDPYQRAMMRPFSTFASRFRRG